MAQLSENLIKKYNVAGPRYTSYPTVPYWEDNIDTSNWLQTVKSTFNRTNSTDGISLYIHLPFCESLCTYCGCNKHITKNHFVEKPHIDYILKEWKMYLNVLGDTPKIKELHLGGGTPTFFSPENLEFLLTSIFKDCVLISDSELSFEAHPNNTTIEHLNVLNKLGFKRISLGVQDFSEKVQQAINRKQTVKQVKITTENARITGYNSVNFDLIYGLPFQTLESVTDTIKKTIELKPDRIAFYSYAHVPWLKPSQRGYDENDLPQPELKRNLYETGKKMFLDAGYVEVGMDHFALPTDALYLAMQNKTLHRNFMGYTPVHTELMVGLGVSSISDSWNAFGQNVKTIKEYYNKLDKNEFPFLKGHLLSDEDLYLRKKILEIMCHFEAKWHMDDDHIQQIYAATQKLSEAQNDGLIEIYKNKIMVTELGIPFVRNICMAFDARLMRKAPDTSLFSSTV